MVVDCIAQVLGGLKPVVMSDRNQGLLAVVP